MRGKKAKAIRKFVSTIGHNPRNVVMEGGTPRKYAKFSRNEEGELVYDPMGTITLMVEKGVPATLSEDCGRKIYQEVKWRA